MDRRILVVVDGGGLAEGGVRVLAQLDRPRQTQVLLVTLSGGDPDEPSRRLEEAGVVVRSRQLKGSVVLAGSLIRSAAHEFGADLAAIQASGRTASGALLLVGREHRVVSLLPGPVLLLPAPPDAAGATRGRRRLLVAVRSLAALPGTAAAVRDLTVDPGASVLLLHVLAPAGPEGKATVLFEAARGLLPALEGRMETRVVRGARAAGEEVAGVAADWNADLVVACARHSCGPGGLILGAVPHQVVRLASRPLLLAPREAAVAPG